jgi:hypothetical protein
MGDHRATRPGQAQAAKGRGVVSRRFDDWESRHARDLEKEPTYTGRSRFPYRSATEQREVAHERLSVQFARHFVDSTEES